MRRRFEEAYQLHFERLYAYARAITRSDELAKDVVSDVFFNLWKMGEALTQIKELEYYLLVAVKNQAIRSLSSNPSKLVSLDFEHELRQIERINPEEVFIEKELRHAIDQAIAQLPDHCQLVYRMVKERQMSYREVSAELGIAESTVKNHMIRAMGSIREQVKAHLSASDDPSDVSLLGVMSLLLAGTGIGGVEELVENFPFC